MLAHLATDSVIYSVLDRFANDPALQASSVTHEIDFVSSGRPTLPCSSTLFQPLCWTSSCVSSSAAMIADFNRRSGNTFELRVAISLFAHERLPALHAVGTLYRHSIDRRTLLSLRII